MKIERIIVGAYETNCYIIRRNSETAACLIIDPGIEAEPSVRFLEKQGLNPIAVVLTHGHIDHIGGLEALRAKYPDIKVHIHKLDSDMLTGQKSNLSELMGPAFTTKPADILLEEYDSIKEAGIELEVLHTPGHTPGGICLYEKNEGILFVGDTLFAGSIGRTDFPEGSTSELLKSIRDKLFTLPENTVCYPGHGNRTTIAHEKAHNPFLQ